MSSRGDEAGSLRSSSERRPDDFDAQCDEFERCWKDGQPLEIAEQLFAWSEPRRSELLHELLIIELRYRNRRGDRPRREEYYGRFPEHRVVIERVFDRLEKSAQRLESAVARSTHIAPQRDAADAAAQRVLRDPLAAEPLPARVGRYCIERELGSGGFGRVFLAYDDQLQRRVAIKMPRPDRAWTSETAEAYLDEARIVAGLTHAAITPVFDYGQTAHGQCYVVSKFIDGMNLAERIRQHRPSPEEASRLVATIAEALHHAHSLKLIHRDVKPANILLDAMGAPFITDFGLALRQERYGKDGAFAGTPAYMSPEQARGEGHLVDGRSDIFSLGVVFYELLTGERPFIGDTAGEILDRIQHIDARPPRQLNSSLSKELERICLKCIAKRATDRYSTALDLAHDLRAALRDDSLSEASSRRSVSSRRTDVDDVPLIVPKGLRSFDEGDAEFYLQLVAGARDREGVPDCIRFWKSRIEDTDEGTAFRVGFMYGPSGSGKSSLVKAGLLPRLAGHVQIAFVDCDADHTEQRLAGRICRLVPGLSGDLPLDEALGRCRTDGQLTAGRKTLIVLDQFEQWLHRREITSQQPLIRALRQCDGGRLQCLILVRDDFWLAVHRLSQQLEVDLSPEKNIAVVDLLDEVHARKVLIAFGRAFRRLPADEPLTDEQQRMLDLAIAGLSQSGQIAPIRLALFAEMIKHRPWTLETLSSVGGVEGVGVAFLHENLDASTSPTIRPHRRAARDVLRSFLPDQHTTIRGPVRSHGELIAACDYQDDPRRFAELMRVLDGELRLLTPTEMDVDRAAERKDTSAAERRGAAYYQLTHDFLVAAIREWLEREQRQTRRGRAELVLEERARAWAVQPESRHLPTLWQLISIRSLTNCKRWDEPQRRLLRATQRYHAWRVGSILAVLAVAIAAFLAVAGYQRGRRLVRELRIAQFDQVPDVVRRIQEHWLWTGPSLRDSIRRIETGAADAKETLRTRMALLPGDPEQLDELLDALLSVDADEFPVLRQFLAEHRTELRPRLWAVLNDPREVDSRRFRAACAVTDYENPGRGDQQSRWLEVVDFVVDQQLAAIEQAPIAARIWIDALSSTRNTLLEPLMRVFRDGKRSELDRFYAATILANYAHDDPRLLADLLQEADTRQFEIIFSALSKHAKAVDLLTDSADSRGADLASSAAAAARQARRAIGLLRGGQADAYWDVLRRSSRPSARTQAIHLSHALQVDPGVLVDRLRQESDAGVQQAILLALGDVSESNVDEPVLAIVRQLFIEHPDSGVHSAAQWLLGQWQRGNDIDSVLGQLATGVPVEERAWYVTRHQRLTMIVHRPVEFMMGTPRGDPLELPREDPHLRRIPRRFAIAATETTIGQFNQFFRERFGGDFREAVKRNTRGDESVWQYAESDECPIGYVDWELAARFCNWMSEKEGIAADEWCYRELDNRRMVFADGFLQRGGYRLPTEAEWECACRAGTTTSRFIGDSDAFLPQYAWYMDSSSWRLWPVGLLRPNDAGMFDVLGNVLEWCNDRFGNYPQAEVVFDTEQIVAGDVNESASVERVSRGGSLSSPARFVRSATRDHRRPTTINAHVGFRVARSIIDDDQ